MIHNETVICEYHNGIIGFSCIENRWEDLFFEPSDSPHRVGNIYVARVVDTPTNLDAVFVEISKGVRCFLPQKEQLHTRASENRKNRLREGDEIPVQIIKDAVKTKDAVVSERLSLTGKYIVITSENNVCGYSSAFRTSQRNLLKDYLGQIDDFEYSDKVLKYQKDYGIIFRTSLADEMNALERCGSNKDTANGIYNALFEELLCEIGTMCERMEQLIHKGKTRTIYSVLHEEMPNYIVHAWDRCPERIITDIPSVYDKLIEYQQEYGKVAETELVLRDPAEYSLSKIHSVETKVEELLKPRVWLKSGANIVIEQTEALTVIDVNTGKNESKIGHDELSYSVNLEAAHEIMRQIRLRHISGMILIDFINMTSKAYNNQLMNELTRLAKSENIKTSVIDMTALGLVEMTRVKKDIFLNQLINNA